MPDPIVITSLAGGLNDSDPPTELTDDQCVTATNVEFHRSTMGERRKGATAIDLTGSAIESCTRVVWLHRHLPTSDPADAQLWALGITDPSTAVLVYKDTTWHTVTMADALTIDGSSEYQVCGVTLHGKLFLAYNSAVNRLHVWDGTSLRRVGMTGLSTAPTAVDTAVGGSYATARYFRTRETVQVAGTTIIRSEPSDVLTFTPNGSFTGAIVTKPATVNTDPAATHWELEASLDSSNWYLYATAAIGTATITDTTAYGVGYAVTVGNRDNLSEDIGDYYPPHSARLLITDEDRLLLLGSFEDSALESSVSWTPVYNATGVGNDERITLDPVSVLNLDGFEGGAITDTGRWAAGELVIGKQAHIYKLIRTGKVQRAYDAYVESKEVGVIPGSMVEGVDAAGNPALYLLDPAVGPYRFTMQGGLQYAGGDVWTSWQTVNLDATHVAARSLYYRTNKQVLWPVATGTSNVPNSAYVVQTTALRTTQDGDARRGYSRMTGPRAGALAMCLFSDNIDDDTDRSRALVPFIAVEGQGLIWQCDTGDDDNGTDYAARITTKPYAFTRLQTDFEIKSATVVAKAVTGASLVLSAIPNGGVTTTEMAEDIDCTPAGSETFVVRAKDDLNISELRTVQFDFADVANPGARWEIARLSVTYSAGQGR